MIGTWHTTCTHRGAAACVEEGVGGQSCRCPALDRHRYFESLFLRDRCGRDVVQVRLPVLRGLVLRPQSRPTREPTSIVLAIQMGCSSCHPSRKMLGCFGADQRRYSSMPRYCLGISALRTSCSVSWPIVPSARPLSSVCSTVGHTTRRFALPLPESTRCVRSDGYSQAALPSLHPRGPDGRLYLSPTGGYELKVLFNGAYRRVCPGTNIGHILSHLDYLFMLRLVSAFSSLFDVLGASRAHDNSWLF